MLRSVALLALVSCFGIACAATAEEEDAASDEAMLGTCAKATTTSALNLRKSPSPTGELVVTLDPNTPVDVIEGGAASGWAHIRANGQEGYAKASYLACSTATKPTLTAKHLDTTLVVDGKIDDAWNLAPAVTFDTDWSGKPTASSTKVRALWNEHALYLLWEVAGTGLNTDHSRPTNVEREGLYKEDCVEIFFTPNPAEPKKYFEIELGPYGHYFDLAIDKKANTSDIRWSSGAELGTTQDAASHSAVIEVALTSPDIVRSLKSGANLPINMFRMEGKGTQQYLAWSPTRTPRPNFHVPEAFGTLAIE